MNYTKPSLPESRRHSFDAEYSADQVQAHADACVAAALAHYKAAAPLCDKHQPSGGTRSGCLVCGLQAQSAALAVVFQRLAHLTECAEKLTPNEKGNRPA